VKFLCIGCDTVMDFAERQLPGDGTMAAVFTCPACRREIAMLTNPMETQLVSSLGVKVGGRAVPGQPMELVRGTLASGGDHAFADDEGDPAHADPGRGGDGREAAGRNNAPIRVTWDAAAADRLSRVPSFVRGMVKRIYTDYAREHGIATITPDIMDRARSDLGLEDM
jgi:hypothetical protein